MLEAIVLGFICLALGGLCANEGEKSRSKSVAIFGYILVTISLAAIVYVGLHALPMLEHLRG